MRRWTQEERERQASLIRSWKPWKRSTGPSTKAGKSSASRNALKHGMRSAEWIAEEKRIKDMLHIFRKMDEDARAK
jgi:hypothetical protein